MKWTAKQWQMSGQNKEFGSACWFCWPRLDNLKWQTKKRRRMRHFRSIWSLHQQKLAKSFRKSKRGVKAYQEGDFINSHCLLLKLNYPEHLCQRKKNMWRPFKLLSKRMAVLLMGILWLWAVQMKKVRPKVWRMLLKMIHTLMKTILV